MSFQVHLCWVILILLVSMSVVWLGIQLGKLIKKIVDWIVRWFK